MRKRIIKGRWFLLTSINFVLTIEQHKSLFWGFFFCNRNFYQNGKNSEFLIIFVKIKSKQFSWEWNWRIDNWSSSFTCDWWIWLISSFYLSFIWWRLIPSQMFVLFSLIVIISAALATFALPAPQYYGGYNPYGGFAYPGGYGGGYPGGYGGEFKRIFMHWFKNVLIVKFKVDYLKNIEHFAKSETIKSNPNWQSATLISSLNWLFDFVLFYLFC